MLDEHVIFFERSFIEQKVNTLAGGQLALGMLRGNALFAAAEAGLIATLFQLVKNMLHRFYPLSSMLQEA